MRLTAADIARIVGGAHRGDAGAEVSSFSIDSRTLQPGACFVALTDTRDGHDFVADAFGRGATVALVARPVSVPPGGAEVLVADPLRALGLLGAARREQLVGATVVGVTGSAGKTATKDLLAAALTSSRRVHASPLSFNNEAGLPLTLLSAADDVDVIVAEMGARFAGNITELCEIARPQVGIVTQIGLAHAGPLGGPAGIAAVKGELVEALPADGVAVLNADDPATPGLAARTGARVVTAGRSASPDTGVRLTGVTLDDELRPSFRLESSRGSFEVQLELRGEHQADNAALAAAAALELGAAPVEIADGFASVSGASWRMQVTRTTDELVIVNDAYNANPTAMTAALRAFGALQVPGRRIAVLGEMLDLGSEAATAHSDVGRQVAASGVHILVVVGRGLAPMANAARDAGDETLVVVEVDHVDAAHVEVAALLQPGDAVLVKASRAVGLERVAELLLTAGASS